MGLGKKRGKFLLRELFFGLVDKLFLQIHLWASENEFGVPFIFEGAKSFLIFHMMFLNDFLSLISSIF